MRLFALLVASYAASCLAVSPMGRVLGASTPAPTRAPHLPGPIGSAKQLSNEGGATVVSPHTMSFRSLHASMGMSKTGSSAIVFNTTIGPFTLNLRPDWAPRGVEHLLKLAGSHFYDDTAFFRNVPGFIVQWGISGDPSITEQWKKPIIDDSPAGVSNTRGTVAFATAGPNTRTTQLFVNLGDNHRLDNMGFTPVGTINKEGMHVVDRLCAEYGEKPDQGELTKQGNRYLKKAFPNLDYVTSARVMSSDTLEKQTEEPLADQTLTVAKNA